ncbi:MAG: D-alanyl-D-alanine carboxypeptidase [Hyphomicrobiaceae bacterium]|nr:D-alanyl-D-alanine carboxypeptidase [Hyphomicrobiaceae bacterium]
MVIDANTGAVLYASKADAERYPASLTKMMTLYMTFDLIEKGRLRYSDQVTISAQASAQPPSKLDLDPGEKITVRDAVRALVTKSANDIAVALAERIAGSERNFARLMTRKAREIGMSRTTFQNASGLPNSEQITTARDMLTLALRLQDDFTKHYEVFNTRQFTYRGKSYRNHNTLLLHYRGTDGIKTGYTRASGFNLVSSVKRNGRHLVAAVFGGKTAGARNAEMRNILDRSFSKASRQKTRKALPRLIAEPRRTSRPKRVAAAATPPPPLPALAPATEPPSTDRAASGAAVDRPAIQIARVKSVGVVEHLSQRPASVEEPAPAASIAGLLAAHSPPDRVATSAEPERPTVPPAADANTTMRGRAPSTLHEQLSRILAAHRDPSNDDGRRNPLRASLAADADAGQSPPPQQPRPAQDSQVSTLRGTVAETSDQPVRPGADRGPFLIQVGAYATPAEAERQLEKISNQASRLVAGTEPVTQPVVAGDRKLYRARFAGFESGRATETCVELRRRSIDCFVMKIR